MSVLGITGIFLGIAILMAFTFKRMDIVWVSVLAAIIVALFNQSLSLETWTVTYMTAAAGFFTTYTPIFLVGCIFAALYSESGASQVIARTIIKTFARGGIEGTRGIVVAVLSSFVMTTIFYLGGIDGMASIIARFPLVLGFFREVNLPRRYIPGCIYIGSMMSALPGSPQIINVIPMSLGTSSTSALVPGIIASSIGAAFAVLFTIRTLKRAKARNEVFHALESDPVAREDKKVPNFFMALIPLIAVFVVFNALQVNIILSMLVGCVLCLILFAPSLKAQNKVGSYAKAVVSCFNTAVPQTAKVILITSSLVGFGNVVSSTDAFASLVATLSSVNSSLQLIFVVIAAAIIVGIMGNPTGGVSAAVNALAPSFLAGGVPPAAFHRLVTLAGTTFDSLPTNAGVLTAIAMPGCDIKEAYPLMFFNSVVATLISAFSAAILMMLFPGLI